MPIRLFGDTLDRLTHKQIHILGQDGLAKAPGSTLAYAENTTSNMLSLGAMADVPGLNISFYAPAGRRIKIMALALGRGDVGTTMQFEIDDGSNNRLQPGKFFNGVGKATDQQTMQTVYVFNTGAGGTFAFKARFGYGAGTGTVDLIAGTTFPAFILAEDITGSVWPSGSQVTAGLIASEPWNTVVPVWSTTGTQPAIGNGTLNMRHVKLGRTVIGTARLLSGSTTTFGTGTWFLSLPFPPNNTISNFAILGAGKAWGAGPSLNFVVRVDNANQKMQFAYSATAPAGTETNITATTPWTWANGHDLDIQFMYEAAS